MSIDGGIAERCWNKFRDKAALVLYTPFVVCLASGTLETAPFLHCISQDVYIFQAFVKACERAERCADDDEDKSAIRELKKRVEEKLDTHDSVVQGWGLELLEESTCDEATVKYVDFLRATASGKIGVSKIADKLITPFEKTKLAAYALSAMAPRMRLCAFISVEIRAFKDPDKNSHIYNKWMDYYTSQSFVALAMKAEELLDRLSVSLIGEELDVIEKLYHKALKLEVDFFAAQRVIQQTVVPLPRLHDQVKDSLTIFCDFDMTCTAFDSSAILAEIAIITAPKIDSDGSKSRLPRMSSAELKSTLDNLSRQYTEEYEECLENIISSEPGIKLRLDAQYKFNEIRAYCFHVIAVANFSYGDLCKALEQFADFEKKANSRVIASGVLKGLDLEDIEHVGKSLILQDGCRDFFQSIVKIGSLRTDFHILSCSWCGDLIRSAFSSVDLDFLEVHSNDLAYEESICTGEMVTKMESALEKLETFKQVVENSDNDDKRLTVYIGGSSADLPCLLEADVGIVMGSSSSLRKLGNHFGVSFFPLLSGLIVKQKEFADGNFSGWKGLAGTLYTATSWAEVRAFILGL